MRQRKIWGPGEIQRLGALARNGSMTSAERRAASKRANAAPRPPWSDPKLIGQINYWQRELDARATGEPGRSQRSTSWVRATLRRLEREREALRARAK